MENQIFLKNFAEAVELESMKTLSTDTVFRELEEWNSLAYLSVIAMLDEEYDIQIESAEFRQLKTIGEIINYIDNHKQ